MNFSPKKRGIFWRIRKLALGGAVFLLIFNTFNFALFLKPLTARAAIPEYLTYQGRLKDSSGTALTGTYDFTFKIYDAAAAGNLVWSETQSTISVSSGYFSVNLGASTALDLDFSVPYWITTTVNSDPEMSPRTRINAVGYAYTAGGVETRAVPSDSTDGGRLYYDSDDGNLYLLDDVASEWVDLTAAASGANTDLGNLANTEINKALLPDGDNTQDIGSVASSWANLYLDGTANMVNASATNISLTDLYATNINEAGSLLSIGGNASGVDLSLNGQLWGNSGLIDIGDAASITSDISTLTTLWAPQICLNGSCQTSWPAGSPGGNDTYVQYNDSSAFGGDSAFTWNETSDLLSMTNASSTNISLTDLYAANLNENGILLTIGGNASGTDLSLSGQLWGNGGLLTIGDAASGTELTLSELWGINTDQITEGGSNKYWSDTSWDTKFDTEIASTTIDVAGTWTFSGATTVNNASSTNVSMTDLYTTNINENGNVLTIGGNASGTQLSINELWAGTSPLVIGDNASGTQLSATELWTTDINSINASSTNLSLTDDLYVTGISNFTGLSTLGNASTTDVSLTGQLWGDSGLLTVGDAISMSSYASTTGDLSYGTDLWGTNATLIGFASTTGDVSAADLWGTTGNFTNTNYGNASGTDVSLTGQLWGTGGLLAIGDAASITGDLDIGNGDLWVDTSNDVVQIGTTTELYSANDVLVVYDSANAQFRIGDDTGSVGLYYASNAFGISVDGTGGEDLSIEENGDIILALQGNVGMGSDAVASTYVVLNVKGTYTADDYVRGVNSELTRNVTLTGDASDIVVNGALTLDTLNPNGNTYYGYGVNGSVVVEDGSTADTLWGVNGSVTGSHLSGTVSTIRGVRGSAVNHETGTITNIRAVEGAARNDGYSTDVYGGYFVSQNVTTVGDSANYYGVFSDINNDAAGASDARLFYGLMDNNSTSGVITTGYGYYFDLSNAAGGTSSIGTLYGIYLNDIFEGTQTSAYAFWANEGDVILDNNGDGLASSTSGGGDIFLGSGQQAGIWYDGTNLKINPQISGSGATSFVAGNVGIATSTPDYLLDIYNGTLAVTDAVISVDLANGAGDLYVANELEVDGLATVTQISGTEFWGTNFTLTGFASTTGDVSGADVWGTTGNFTNTNYGYASGTDVSLTGQLWGSSGLLTIGDIASGTQISGTEFWGTNLVLTGFASTTGDVSAADLWGTTGNFTNTNYGYASGTDVSLTGQLWGSSNLLTIGDNASTADISIAGGANGDVFSIGTISTEGGDIAVYENTSGNKSLLFDTDASMLTASKTLVDDWTQVNSNGFGDTGNLGIFDMEIFNGYLYAGTYKTSGSAELWRTQVGSQQADWAQVNTDGFGDANNDGIFSMIVFHGYLYVGTFNSTTGMELWRSSNGTTWAQIGTDGFGDANSQYVVDFEIFNGYLYAVFGNSTTGMELWRTNNGTIWAQVNTDGFGNANNRGAGPMQAMTVFNNYLYVGTYSNVAGWGLEMWRSADGTTWTEVSSNGFGDTNNLGITGLRVFNGYLYVFTANHVTGVEAWRTQVGSQQSDWTQVNTNGFGDAENWDSMEPTIYNGYLYAGANNATTGAELWRTDDGSSWQQANSDAFGRTSSKDLEIFGLEAYNGYLYACTYMTATTGGRVWRTQTGTITNSSGAIYGQGIYSDQISLIGGRIAGVTDIFAENAAFNAGGVAQNFTVGGDLMVATNTLYVQSAEGRVGVGTANPITNLDVIGSEVRSGTHPTSLSTAYFTGALGAQDGFRIAHSNGTQGLAFGYTGIMKLADNSFTGTGDLTIDAMSTGDLLLQTVSTGKIGIATSTPDFLLDIYGGMVSISDAVIRPNLVNGAGDLYVNNDLEVDNKASIAELSVGGEFWPADIIFANDFVVTEAPDETPGLYFKSDQGDLLVNFQGNGNVGLGDVTNPNYPLEMKSGAHVTAGGVWTDASDERLKHLVEDSPYGLKEILQLEPKIFKYLINDEPDVGFIAQDVKELIPELVTGDANERMLGLKYSHLSAVLVKAIQEQQAQIDALTLANSLSGGNLQGVAADDFSDIGQLTVDKDMVFNGKITVKEQVAFNKDTVGQAEILPDDTEMRVEFDKEYEYQPIVTLTLRGENALNANFKYTVVDESNTGFTIKISEPQEEPVQFNWHAFGADEGKIFISDGNTRDIELVIDDEMNNNEGVINLVVEDGAGGGGGNQEAGINPPTGGQEFGVVVEESASDGNELIVENQAEDNGNNELEVVEPAEEPVAEVIVAPAEESSAISESGSDGSGGTTTTETGGAESGSTSESGSSESSGGEGSGSDGGGTGE